MDHLKPMIAAVKELSDAFGQLPSPIQTAIISLLALVAVAGPAVVVFGKLYVGLGTLGLAFAKFAPGIDAGRLALLGWLGAISAVILAVIAVKNHLADLEGGYSRLKISTDDETQKLNVFRIELLQLGNAGNLTGAQIQALREKVKALDRDYSQGLITFVDYSHGLHQIIDVYTPATAAAGEHAAKVELLAEAFKTLNVTSFGELVTNADLATKAYGNILAAFRKGKADIADVVSSYRSMMATQDELDESFQDFSLHLEGFLPDLLATSLEARSAIDTLTLGLNLTYFATERMKKEFENFGLSARDGIIDVAFAMETLKGTGILGTINTMHELGQKSQMELRDIESRAADLYLRLVELKAPALDIKRAYEAWGEASARAAGLTVEHGQKAVSAWKQVGREIDSAMKHMARGIADIIVEGGKMGKVFVDVAKQIAKAIIEIVILEAVKMLIRHLDFVTDRLGAIGKALKDWAGAAAEVTKTTAKIAGAAAPAATAAGGVGAGGGAAGGAAGGGGLMSILTAAFTGISAVTGIIGMFQQMHQETSLNAIEWNTRKSSLHLEALLNNANQFWPALKDLWGYMWNAQLPMLQAIDAKLYGGGGGVTTITFNISESKSARETAQEVVTLLKRHGIAPAMA
jgi:hypothetical protein